MVNDPYVTKERLKQFGRVNHDMIVLRKSDIKLDGIEQLHGMNETFKRVFRCLVIHRLRYYQLVVVLEVQCHRTRSNTEQVVS